jgi:hypothetical protein
MRTQLALLLGLVGVRLPAVVRAQQLPWPVPYVIVGAGPSIALSRGPVGGRTTAAVDLKLSLPIRLACCGEVTVWSFYDDPAPVLIPELGWAHFTDQRELFQLGLGIGFGDYIRGLGIYMPRFLAGSVGGYRALGIRHGLGARFFMNAAHIEIAHQALLVAGVVWQHDIVLMISVTDPMHVIIRHIIYSLKGGRY